MFTYPDIKGEPTGANVAAISPYLIGADDLNNQVTVRETSQPINGRPNSSLASRLMEVIISSAKMKKMNFLALEPDAEPYLRPYIGAREFLHGEMRYILYRVGNSPRKPFA